MSDWRDWDKPKPKDEITMPYKPSRPATHGLKRKAIPTTIAPSQYGSFMNTPGYNAGQAAHLKTKPDTPETDTDTNNRSTGSSVKTATTSVFTDTFFSALPDYAIDETLSLKSLTGNEILQVSHRENFYTTSEALNRNILDIVESRNFYSPTEIIKLQTPDESYFQNSLAAYTISLASSVVSISIPSYKVAKSYKIQLETFTPREIKNDTIYP